MTVEATTGLLPLDGGADDAAHRRLIEASLDGDVDAFAELYKRYRPGLLAVCRRRLGDAALADDAVQETFLRAFVNLRRFDLARPLWPWIVTIAERCCIDMQRRQARVSLVQEVPEQRCRTRVSRDAEPAVDAVLRREERRRLHRALASLPPRQRRVLLLYALEGWSYADIASAEGLSLVGIKSLIFRARESLRRSCDRAWFGAVLPLKLLVRRASDRARRAETPAAAAQLALGGGVQQIVSTVAALALTFGAPALAPVDAPPAEVSASRVVASVALSPSLDAPARPGAADRWDVEDVQGVVRRIASPGGDADEPEDTRIVHVAEQPGSGGSVLLAVGVRSCVPSCPPALFRSDDGGARWSALPAEGLLGRSVLLPRGDRRIFSMSTAGLQVSEDGGRSFRLAVPAGKLVLGSAAISPTFHEGDPRILVGAQMLMQYDDRVRAFAPTSHTALPGPLEPAFSPTYAEDGLIVVGGSRLDPQRGRVGTVFRCAASVCDETILPMDTPKTVFAADFASSRALYVYDGQRVFASPDAARSFRPVATPWSSGLRDLVAGPGARELWAAVASSVQGNERAGVFRSTDGGATWSRIAVGSSHLPRSVQVVGGRVIVGLERGLACSTDGGATWASRCAR